MKKQLSKQDAEKQLQIVNRIISDLDELQKPQCACLEYVGDNPECKQHGHLYRAYEFGSPEWFAGIPEQEF